MALTPRRWASTEAGDSPRDSTLQQRCWEMALTPTPRVRHRRYTPRGNKNGLEERFLQGPTTEGLHHRMLSSCPDFLFFLLSTFLTSWSSLSFSFSCFVRLLSCFLHQYNSAQ